VSGELGDGEKGRMKILEKDGRMRGDVE